mmetsp:Transcript_17871/g.45803  ORF Transcript_17871/g.45803 Transcript_17871/m.45803 type:complete len:531 (+) Transcript_17871:116-1708(+)
MGRAGGHVLRVFLALSGLKLLLLPAYRSTDFEVHRNWLAITASLPFSQWYLDATSQWTLDYPPFFAWFEWALAQAAAWADPAMLRLDNLEYASPATVAFQRLSVVATDAVLAGSVALAARPGALWAGVRGTTEQHAAALAVLVLGSAGLLVVDHIHFQYNGVMMGVFLASAVLMTQGRELAAGVLFAALLNLKHIYLYCAPVFFMHLLRVHCCASPGPGGLSAPPRLRPGALAGLGTAVAAVFALSLGPVVATGQLRALAGRLFPFGRGLCHAYWAANVWALYSGADKVLAAVLPRLGVAVASGTANMSGGLVAVSHFSVLPQIRPAHTAAAVLLAQVPALWALWARPSRRQFLHAVTYACMCSFMLGYHVHEKAALMVTLPMALMSLESADMAGQYLFTSTVAHYAILPLIFTPQEYAIKILLWVLHALVAAVTLSWWHLSRAAPPAGGGRPPPSPAWLLSLPELAFLGGLPCLELYCAALHPRLFAARLPFLPLMLTSIYCAVGMSYAWARLADRYLRPPTSERPKAH